jgi:hypothetical protein
VLSHEVDHAHFVCKSSGSTASNARLQKTALAEQHGAATSRSRIATNGASTMTAVARSSPNRMRGTGRSGTRIGSTAISRRLVSTGEGRFYRYSSARDPSARSHACSAASAISEMEAAALRCPVRCASAAARWSCQMAETPSRASIDKARLSASVGRIIREPYRRGRASVFAADLSTNHAIADASARHTTP